MMLKKKFDQDFCEKTGMINIYSCSCGRSVVYIYMDDGVTPLEIICDKCGRSAYSRFATITQPTRYWYRPKDIKELRKIAKAAWKVGEDTVYKGEKKEEVIELILNNYIEHYNNGGLFARMIYGDVGKNSANSDEYC